MGLTEKTCLVVIQTMDYAIRQICADRFLARTGQQPSDHDIEIEGAKYFAEQAELAAQVQNAQAVAPEEAPQSLEPSSEEVGQPGPE